MARTRPVHRDVGPAQGVHLHVAHVIDHAQVAGLEDGLAGGGHYFPTSTTLYSGGVRGAKARSGTATLLSTLSKANEAS